MSISTQSGISKVVLVLIGISVVLTIPACGKSALSPAASLSGSVIFDNQVQLDQEVLLCSSAIAEPTKTTLINSHKQTRAVMDAKRSTPITSSLDIQALELTAMTEGAKLYDAYMAALTAYKANPQCRSTVTNAQGQYKFDKVSGENFVFAIRMKARNYTFWSIPVAGEKIDLAQSNATDFFNK